MVFVLCHVAFKFGDLLWLLIETIYLSDITFRPDYNLPKFPMGGFSKFPLAILPFLKKKIKKSKKVLVLLFSRLFKMWRYHLLSGESIGLSFFLVIETSI